MSDQETETLPAPAPHFTEDEVETSPGRKVPPGFVGNSPPVPPPGVDEEDDPLGKMIARVEKTLGDTQNLVAEFHGSFDLMAGQVRSFHQEIRLNLAAHKLEVEQKFKQVEAEAAQKFKQVESEVMTIKERLARLEGTQ
jgi:hypothetical protein